VVVVNGPLPLSTLLSSALVAYTIEFDNESEHRMAHRTTNHASSGPRDRPWLGSLVLWSNCMEHVGPDGVTVGEMRRLARTDTNLAGMQRWGYIVVETDSTAKKAKPGPGSLVRSTSGGRRAQEVWRPLFGVIDERWQARFGQDSVGSLTASMRAVAEQLDQALPDCLPILRYGLFSTDKGSRADRQDEQSGGHRLAPIPAQGLGLSTLLARILLTFAIEYEGDSNVSLAIGANVLRVFDEPGVRVRDLPILTGLSRESISMAMGILQKRRLARVEADPAGGRLKVARLTSEGRQAQDAHHRLVKVIEERWETRFGESNVRALRSSLEPLVGGSTAESSPLFRGLEPYPEGWRAAARRPSTLPHFPTVLHRGGFPDGS
jgi:DNA-binding MarR family transcriptional regulator